jgi:methyltransferase family protein
MERLQLDFDPYANDPGHWGASLVNLAELVVGCLETAGARSVVEVGAYAGDLTGLLVDWAGAHGAQISAVDPSPQPELVALAQERGELELVRETSLEALRHVPLPDAAVIDGDHNWHTVSEELRLIAERAGSHLPLLLFHDVSWPHARRDDYFDPAAIPADRRQPIQEGGGLYPGVEGLRDGGLPYRYPAVREGGPRNGVLTAVEEFVAAHDDLRLAVVPAFFGLGVVWRDAAPWGDALGALLAHWDRNPLLERLEANRVLHLASSHFQMVEAVKAQQRAARQEAVLRRLLDSSAFAVAERLSRLRMRAGVARGASVVSKDDIRHAIADG